MRWLLFAIPVVLFLGILVCGCGDSKKIETPNEPIKHPGVGPERKR